MKDKIWTIGHSNKSFDVFAELLKEFKIEAIADVRRFPGSKRYPHFNKEIFSLKLKEVGIEYYSIPELGGRRHARKDSKNTAWRSEAFRGYADYMETSEFEIGIKELLKISKKYNTAIMCSEVLWWNCHRSLISDYLKIRGYNVIHILGMHQTVEHPYTSAAKIDNGKLNYSGTDQLNLEF